MAATKTARTIQSSTSVSAAATQTSAALDLTTKYGGTLTAKITNGGTGPALPCSLYVEVSNDNSAWKTYSVLTATATNSAVAEFAVQVPASVMYLRTVFKDHTSQAVTVEAFFHELTTI